tara:strand:- start:603 stop:1799 length:1197 start_codon:yes stop_codon:yes gene_type:complete
MSKVPLSLVTPVTAEILRGHIDLERTPFGTLPHRLPAWARAQGDDPQLAMTEAQPSGVRLVFRTAATVLELDTLPTKRVYVGLPARAQGVYDLCVDGQLLQQKTAIGGKTIRIDITNGTTVHEPGQVQTLRFEGLSGQVKLIEIWLPHDETTELGSLRSDAPIEPVHETARPVWLHHGSSISQGSNAASPTGIWPARAARLANVDLVNLGFGGGALLDPFTARTMRDTAADLISVKIGINLVNLDLMRLRAFGPAVHGFLDTIRDGHPTTPLLVVSPIFCPIHEATPGPGMFDMSLLAAGRLSFLASGNPKEVAQGKLTLEVIRKQLEAIIASRSETDDNIHYLDGRTLYGEADNVQLPLPDQLHPDAQTHRLIGDRFSRQLQTLLPTTPSARSDCPG